MAQQAAAATDLKPKAKTSSRVSSALKSGVVFGGSAVLTAVNNITPHIAGAVDILVIEQPDGSRKATPFYVRFGKYTALRTGERDVKLYVNDELAPFGMHIGMYGQAYFAEPAQVSNGDDEDDQEALLAGIMSPPSGYSSGAEDSGQPGDTIEAGETLKAVRQRIDGMKEARTKAPRRATAPGKVVVMSGGEGGPPVPALGAGDRAVSMGARSGHSNNGAASGSNGLAEVKLAPALSMADRNESFLSARETLFTPLGDDVVASALAAASGGFSSAASQSLSVVAVGAAEGGLAAVPETGYGAAELDQRGGMRTAPSSATSLTGISEGASPCGWSEDEVEARSLGGQSLEGRRPRESSPPPSCGGSPEGSVFGTGARAGADGSAGEVAMGEASTSTATSSAVETPALDVALGTPPPQLPGMPAHAHQGMKPLHQQLGFPENRELPAGAGGGACAGGSGTGTALLADPFRDAALTAASSQPAQHGSQRAMPVGVMQATVDWEQLLGPQRDGDGSGAGMAIVGAASGATSPSERYATPMGAAAPSPALDAPRVSSHRGGGSQQQAAEGFATGGATGMNHGSGSHQAISLLSSSLRGRGSHGGGHGGDTLASTCTGGSGSLAGATATSSSSLAWLRAKTGQRDSFESVSALPQAHFGSPAVGFGSIASALSAAAALPAPASPPPARSVAASLSSGPDGRVRLKLCVLPDGPAATPVDLGAAAAAAAAAHGVVGPAPPDVGGGGAAGLPLPLLDMSSIASDSGYLGDGEHARSTTAARLHHQHGQPHAHHLQHHHHHHHHGHTHAPNPAHHFHGIHGTNSLPHPPHHYDLHSSSAPLPSSGGAVQAAAAAAVAAATAGSGAMGPANAGTSTSVGGGGGGVFPSSSSLPVPSSAAAVPGMPGSMMAAASLELSLCGAHLTTQTPYKDAANLFEALRVSEQSFLTRGPALLTHPDLVVRFHDGTIYPWQPLSFSLVGLLAFGAWRLPPDMPCWSPAGAAGPPAASAAAAAASLLAAVAQGASAAAAAAAGGSEGGRDGGVSAVAAAAMCSVSANTTPKKGGAAGGGTSSWRLWMFGGRRESGRTSATGGSTTAATGPALIGGRSPPLSSPLAERLGSLDFPTTGGAIAPGAAGQPVTLPATGSQLQTQASQGVQAVGAAAAVALAVASSDGGGGGEGGTQGAAAAAAAAAAAPGVNGGGSRGRGHHPREAYQVVTKKSLTPTPEQLAQLPLKRGQNTIVYKIGGRELKAYVYYLPWRTKIVISDIDGTITKSDVLGHLLPYMGLDWSHPGIAELLTNIRHNNYLIMYLSSRSISQANITRDFINTLVQGEHRMPLGPVIISPHGLLPSLYREMILRRPHEFKIATLQDIRALFPPDWNPFYGGFGNRDTDEISYREVGVKPERIFIINPRGELRQAQDSPPPIAVAPSKSKDGGAATATAADPVSVPSANGPAAGVAATAVPTASSAGDVKDAGTSKDGGAGAARNTDRTSEDRGVGSAGGGASAGVSAPDASEVPAADVSSAGPVAPAAAALAASASSGSSRDLAARSASGLSRGRSASGSSAGGPVVLSTLAAINDLVHAIFPRLKDGLPVPDGEDEEENDENRSKGTEERDGDKEVGPGGDGEEESSRSAERLRNGSGGKGVVQEDGSSSRSSGEVHRLSGSNNADGDDRSGGTRPSSRDGDVGSDEGASPQGRHAACERDQEVETQIDNPVSAAESHASSRCPSTETAGLGAAVHGASGAEGAVCVRPGGAEAAAASCGAAIGGCCDRGGAAGGGCEAHGVGPGTGLGGCGEEVLLAAGHQGVADVAAAAVGGAVATAVPLPA